VKSHSFLPRPMSAIVEDTGQRVFVIGSEFDVEMEGDSLDFWIVIPRSGPGHADWVSVNRIVFDRYDEDWRPPDLGLTYIREGDRR
jgi:hypothetical protein